MQILMLHDDTGSEALRGLGALQSLLTSVRVMWVQSELRICFRFTFLTDSRVMTKSGACTVRSCSLELANLCRSTKSGCRLSGPVVFDTTTVLLYTESNRYGKEWPWM